MTITEPCSTCNGDGWTAEHSPEHYAHPERDCYDYGCPIQVACEDCEGTGEIVIEI